MKGWSSRLTARGAERGARRAQGLAAGAARIAIDRNAMMPNRIDIGFFEAGERVVDRKDWFTTHLRDRLGEAVLVDDAVALDISLISAAREKSAPTRTP